MRRRLARPGAELSLDVESARVRALVEVDAAAYKASQLAEVGGGMYERYLARKRGAMLHYQLASMNERLCPDSAVDRPVATPAAQAAAAAAAPAPTPEAPHPLIRATSLTPRRRPTRVIPDPPKDGEAPQPLTMGSAATKKLEAAVAKWSPWRQLPAPPPTPPAEPPDYGSPLTPRARKLAASLEVMALEGSPRSTKQQ